VLASISLLYSLYAWILQVDLEAAGKERHTLPTSELTQWRKGGKTQRAIYHILLVPFHLPVFALKPSVFIDSNETRAMTQLLQDTVLTDAPLGVRVALAGNRQFFQSLGYRIIRYDSHPGYSEPTFLRMEKRLV
jgi:hypothetical protein